MRIFNTYGPRMRPNNRKVVSNFIIQVLHYEDITDLRGWCVGVLFWLCRYFVKGAIRMVNSHDGLMR